MSWQLNKVLGRLPAGRLVWLTPLVEEATKTVPALLLVADVFLTHVFFGAVEAAWEMVYARRNGFYAGLSALASHSVFGAITAVMYHFSGAFLPALGAGYLAHAAWNYAVLALFSPGKNRAGR